jgi:hypothetical protein
MDTADKAERLDRELSELLQELRVVLPGVQVLLAFLLTAPFSARFAEITDAQRAGYFVALLAATAASALLMSPPIYHRVQWRARDKEQMLRVANRLSLAGSAFLATSICVALYVVTDFLFNLTAALGVGGGAVVLFAALWYAIPGVRRARQQR